MTAKISPDEALYPSLHPYYAEICALSEIRKKPGFGAKLRSGMGGHAILYLNGVRVDRRSGYPVLVLCGATESAGEHGVCVSVNSHYRNANWVAAEGRDFVWRGALRHGEALTRAGYERTQDLAKAQGMLDGIEFHEHLFRDKPPFMSKRDYMYEISIATDYALRFGRNIYRARVPLDRQRMSAIVDYLNALNAPYREGRKVFRWRVLNNNCSHVAHNALACAGLWAPWPTGRCFATAAFDFPVPKNEFVDIVCRTNDLPIADARAMFEDTLSRRSLLEFGALPTGPGALAVAEGAIPENEIYDLRRLRLIFYANPFWGKYLRHFARILAEPRYSDLRTNYRHFARIFEMALNRPRSGRDAEPRSDAEAAFLSAYDRYIEHQAARVNAVLSRLAPGPEITEEVA